MEIHRTTLLTAIIQVTMALRGKVCLVTGATRGIGRGIALQLGEAGATVYVTGRTMKTPEGAPVGGSLEDTQKEIEGRGGVCIPVQCDHSKDDEVAAVFDRIKKEQDGQLDILVNNAYAAVKILSETIGKSTFWEQNDNMWDDVNRVGLRNHYICTVHAARMMVPRKQGLIVNVSSAGGLKYAINVAYGIGKAALDRMAADCAKELRKHKVAMISLWPGFVRTENIVHSMSKPSDGALMSATFRRMFEKGETPEFSGRCIVRLALDPNIMKKSGRVLITGDIADEYGGFKDVDGQNINSLRSLAVVLDTFGWTKTATYVPSWVKIPYFMMTLSASKF